MDLDDSPEKLLWFDIVGPLRGEKNAPALGEERAKAAAAAMLATCFLSPVK